MARNDASLTRRDRAHAGTAESWAPEAPDSRDEHVDHTDHHHVHPATPADDASRGTS